MILLGPIFCHFKTWKWHFHISKGFCTKRKTPKFTKLQGKEISNHKGFIQGSSSTILWVDSKESDYSWDHQCRQSVMGYKLDGQVHGLPKIYSGYSHLDELPVLCHLKHTDRGWRKLRRVDTTCQGKHLQQSEWAGLARTTELMGLSMYDDTCVSFGRVSVLGLTFVINARKKWLERCILKYIPLHVPNSTSILSHKIKILVCYIPDVFLFLKKLPKFWYHTVVK